MASPSPDPEITPEEFVASVERGEPQQVLDVRAQERLAGGRVDLVPADRFFNIRGSQLMATDDLRSTGIDPDRPLTIVCGFGNDSLKLARRFVEQGFPARSLAGGMVSWGELEIPRELSAPPGAERLIQFDRIGKGALGYVLISDGDALVIDPPRHPVAFHEVVEMAGARIAAVADTHAHADYISGGPSLAAAVGAPYYLHPKDAVYPYDGRRGLIEFEPLEEGAEIRVGRVTVTAHHFPGHTEGSIVYRIGDTCALTGDLLFVGSVGRPDLGERTEEWTAVLWRSLERARREWPADLLVLPAHYGSHEERAPDRSVAATLAEIPTRNEPFAIADEESFTRWIMARAGSFPEQYKRIKAINIGLEQVGGDEARELDSGRNECALG